ncbi:MAG: helix-turn-helix domain-containing protein [Actinomycetota bacterium]
MVTEADADAAVEVGPDARQAKIDHILSVAMNEFAERGYAGTSMAAIAAAAGVSRPALYQFFSNREDVFRSALAAVMADANRAALDELERDAPLAVRLDGFLQRRFGDVIERVVAMPHGAEVADAARLSVAPDVAAEADRVVRAGLEAHLRRTHPRAAVRKAADLLLLGVLGLKADHPTIPAYRKRLTTVAEATAALLGESPEP